MNLARNILKSPGGKAVLLVLFGYLAFQGWLAVTAPAKLEAGLSQNTDQLGRVNVVVELNFPPERFHILTLQEYGRVTGTSGNQVQMRRVPLENVDRLARTYWVREITLLRE